MTFAEEVIKLRGLCKQQGIENTNLKKKNEHLQNRVRELAAENRKLQEENKELKKAQQLLKQQYSEQEKAVENLKLIVEELRLMVFKKKGGKGKDTEDTNEHTSEAEATENEGEKQKKKRKKANRHAASYRRKVPAAADVTACIEHELTACPECGTLLTDIKQIIRYVEDLVELTKIHTLLKQVEKHIIWSGYCGNCKKRKIAFPISPQVSVLGEQVKRYISYEVVVMKQSIEQVQRRLQDIANLSLSDGEIIASLDDQAEQLKPEEERVIKKVRAAPGSHYDESSWVVQEGGEGEGNYCWIRRPTIGEEAVFRFGKSRGKENAKALQGNDDHVGISDDYGAYKHMFTEHQLCMSHPQRKLRDLKESKVVAPERQKVCQETYEAFSILYKKLEGTLASPYEKKVWDKHKEEYIIEMRALAQINGDEPEKLRKIKAGLERNAEKYFTCLNKPGIPADNNKAERGLRHVALKRKNCYGSKSQKGADTMSILHTTLLSAWWKRPANFFVAYEEMLRP